ncbi:hypothetical protein DW790_04770 [Firmicutes bacterium AM31-12AC]|nr:hypothetical protein DW790_04770 [Firmicutes bacterium AM31-12AC]
MTIDCGLLFGIRKLRNLFFACIETVVRSKFSRSVRLRWLAYSIVSIERIKYFFCVEAELFSNKENNVIMQ